MNVPESYVPPFNLEVYKELMIVLPTLIPSETKRKETPRPLFRR